MSVMNIGGTLQIVRLLRVNDMKDNPNINSARVRFNKSLIDRLQAWADGKDVLKLPKFKLHTAVRLARADRAALRRKHHDTPAT